MKAFFDTNVLLYLFDEEDDRYWKARRVVEEAENGCISVQVLNEFAAVARRFKRPWGEIRKELDTFKALFQVSPLTLDLHERGLGISEASGYGLYDSLLLAAALDAGCAIFWSEDLRDGHVIEGGLTIRNPFV